MKPSPFPTLGQIDRASTAQLSEWRDRLPLPGVSHFNERLTEKEFIEVYRHERAVLDRIEERLGEQREERAA